ncbi:MAG: TetR/AcrR family transcriptional regulator [Solirubrobacterales bacterium]|nr:TetR/AcrR family transcriptional regulator [Solirubrobacterales bacterium]MBV9362663.1 TetR/AcrR family transcriptional regulator [Solirubrobacterales bacterium]MBV9682445.1 TetR/AcrR family transcriptional regulator [Solirubrobacterales bacterium]MBV9808730.1 TetR/AcrR family transcriptional regulator [Solirubrobacterales bacterium]
MRHSKEEKAASHERIVAIAAARIRESGTEQPGVAEIMRAAGLTHGGFYKHFGSRDELIAEAVKRALNDGESKVPELTAGEDPLAAFADAYLSTAHRDEPATGCGVVALGTDMPRVGGPAQEAYRAQVERYLAHLEQLMEDDDDEATRGRATVTLSAMVGAVMIARALGPTRRSDEILRDVREAIRERRLL